MAFEFDKEINSLLRQAARRAELAPAAGHLDPDELTAFVENALPETARFHFAAHLADCSNCRALLANLTLLNEAAAEEPFGVARQTETIKSTKTSWLESFRKLFAFPAVGFASATLAILFVAALAFFALRDRDGAASSIVARVESTDATTPQPPPAAASAGAATTPEQSSTTAIEQSSTENQTELQTAQTAPASNGPASDAAAASTSETARDADNNGVAASAANQAARSGQATNTTTAGSLNNSNVARSKSNNSPANSIVAAENRAAKPGAATANKNARGNEIAQRNAGGLMEIFIPNALADDSQPPLENRDLSGKTFQKRYGIWQDTAYKGQNTKQVARSSKEYKKLDAGLRKVVEKLDGETIVVWQNKAYRIK